VTPVSVRFLGRKVFFGAVVLIVAALRDGPSRRRLQELKTAFGASVRTVRRWCRFWRDTFAGSRVWRSVSGRFATPIPTEAMPGSLLEALSGIEDTADRVVAALRLVAGP
jgi:hypothetical protein